MYGGAVLYFIWQICKIILSSNAQGCCSQSHVSSTSISEHLEFFCHTFHLHRFKVHSECFPWLIKHVINYYSIQLVADNNIYLFTRDHEFI
jgi:hypothetical protein